MAAVEWQLDVALPPQPRTHVEENFTSLYSPEGLALRMHPNGLCVVCLAPSHPALDGGGTAPGGGKQQGVVAAAAAAACAGAGDAPDGAAAAAAAVAVAAPDQCSTEFSRAAQQQQQQGGEQEARLVLSAKLLQADFRKGRGPWLQADTILGRLHVGGTEHVLRCGVRGQLIELNERLAALHGDKLLRELPATYLAVLEVRAAEAAQLAGRCQSEGQQQQQQQQQQQGQKP